MGAKAKPNEIHLTRIYDAPVKAVWDAWTDPNQVAQWWGPRGFTLTTHAKDLRVGGVWNYTMHGPDGTDYPNKTTYLEVEPLRRLVYDHGATDDRPPLFRVTVLFADLGGKTQMDMTMALATAEAAAETKKFVKKAGGESTWDRLAEHLGKRDDGVERFVINRSFSAPINVVFDMWTQPHHVEKWMPPAGAKMEYIKADIRAGGTSTYKWTAAGMAPMFGKAEYIEVRRPDRLVYTQQFIDEGGNVSRHAMAPTWPETMLTTVTFAEESSGQTRVTVEWQVHGKFTAEEMATFIGAKAGMSGGWTGSFDNLEEYLPSQL